MTLSTDPAALAVVAAAGHVISRRAIVVCLELEAGGVIQMLRRYLASLTVVTTCPFSLTSFVIGLSSGVAVPPTFGISIPNTVELCSVPPGAGFGAARKSAVTGRQQIRGAVCSIDALLEFSPIGSRPNTVIRQNTAMPRAKVTSTREKALFWARLFICDIFSPAG